MDSVRRWLARVPVWLYRARLGWLLGSRFLLLTHRGRRSGLPRDTVLEVVHHDRASDVYVVASALGEQADWILNIQENPYVAVTVGLRRFVATTRRLGVIESAAVLLAHGRAHPLAFRMVTRFVTGRELRPTISSCHGLAQVVPLVALSSRTTVPTTIGMTGRARRRLGANLSCASSGSRGR